MSDEFANWNDLTKLWHAEGAAVSVDDVERHARRQHQSMWRLAAAEAGALLLAFIAAMWIALQTAYVAMSALSMVFFGVCAYLQFRMRREPAPYGGEDLLTALDASIARETWNLGQLGVGRAVTLLTLFGIVMVASDHLRHYATTPPARLGALIAITGIVIGILAWNLVLTVRARRRKQRLDGFASQLKDAS